MNTPLLYVHCIWFISEQLFVSLFPSNTSCRSPSSPTPVAQSQLRSAQFAYVSLPVYRASLAARSKKQPLEIAFLYWYPLLNEYICHFKPPLHFSIFHREACSLNTAWAIDNQEGLSSLGLEKLVSAAIMAVIAQKD